MRKIYTLLLTSLLCTSAIAQNATSYFMEGSTMRSQWNAAFAPQRGYINIPILGGIQADITGNTALDNIIYSSNGKLTTILDASVPASVALSNINEMNYTGFGLNMNIIGFGAYTKNSKNFWSVDINMRADADMRVPYEFFDFMKRGVSGNFANLGMRANSYIETCFTYSFPITDRLYLGVRGKFLLGAARAAFNFTNFEATMGADRWYAEVAGDMEIAGVAPSTKVIDNGTTVYDMDEMGEEMKIPAGYGFGLDVGATYNVLPELQLSLSANDIGALFWSKKGSAMGYINESMEFTGIEIDADGNATQPKFDLEEMNFIVDKNRSRSTMLQTSINAGAEYNFLDRRISLGMFYSVKFREYQTRHMITAAANFRPLKWLHLSGSYSYLGGNQHNTGLALNICPGFINLFVGTDILLCKKTPQWIPIKQSNANITFGLGIPIGRRSMRNNYF